MVGIMDPALPQVYLEQLFGGSYVKDPLSINAVIKNFVLTYSSPPYLYNYNNPPNMDLLIPEDQSGIGTVFFWIGYGEMAIFALLFGLLTFRRSPEKRTFHLLTTAYLTISALAYYCMARQQGSVALYETAVVTTNHPQYRVFYYARYVDWFFTCPLIITNLCLLVSSARSLWLGLVFSNMLMIGAGMMGELSTTGTRWGWFAFAIVAWIPTWYSLLKPLRKYARDKAPAVEKTYTVLMILTLASWIVYPVIWIISGATHVISLNAEIIIYTITDAFSKCFFAFILLFSTAAIEDASFRDPERMKMSQPYSASTIYQGVLETKA
mmetsp:Transcript_10019/g.17449  ORF Transcript_10019/g.17449 Transcript_10019/m.17449 type:complete len:324 (+) Transcript_10019:121-1092(+)|eukprot:CAMPEP_0196658820 /NCGR_PEP_ID=MMETSP1086-20130531/31771_1 /TAXON_ID=77921 /ORGANISM="Cyanoptyche  gloeocystis , Strain SAG4.97" /LENGTH=323 /DNA_ID=CAMNT_0041992569 /DNA_START=105 /DNA_END=1076 /DNA_ORIENTATION=-